MKIEIISSWNEDFFSRFLDFKNLIHKDIATSFPEVISDYGKYFGTGSVFNQDFKWEAYLLIKDGSIAGKCILCWQNNSQVGNIGFIDFIKDPSVAQTLFTAVESSALKNKLHILKTPVDLNFFIKYRIRLPGGGKPFWGEPIYPDYYHDLFRSSGYEVIGHWDTFRMKKLPVLFDYMSKRKTLNKKSGNPAIVLRNVDLSKWDEEIKTIHELFVTAYNNMPEWAMISFEQFKTIYDDFRYIINPLYAFIVEHEGRPVGFSINFADPLPVLLKFKNKKLSAFSKFLLFTRLRLNLSTLLIAHVGKIPATNGEEIKGVQIKVSRKLQTFGLMMNKVLVTFQMTGSPSRRSFDENTLELYAQYVLYGKNLK